MVEPIFIDTQNGTMFVTMDDGTKRIAYPYAATTWRVTDSLGGGGGNSQFYWPFDPNSIDSEWGYRPPPLPGLSDFHSGCDWSEDAGTNILAAGAGTVYMVRAESEAGSPGGTSWGNRVIIYHGNVGGVDLYTAYAHMRNLNFPMVAQGETVVAGQVIGEVGTTGSSTGNHLHFVTFIGGLLIGDNSDPKNCANPRDFMAIYNPNGLVAAG